MDDLSSQLHLEMLLTKSYFPKHSLNVMAKSTKWYIQLDHLEN